jgi:hypothetical protein
MRRGEGGGRVNQRKAITSREAWSRAGEVCVKSRGRLWIWGIMWKGWSDLGRGGRGKTGSNSGNNAVLSGLSEQSFFLFETSVTSRPLPSSPPPPRHCPASAKRQTNAMLWLEMTRRGMVPQGEGVRGA